MPQTGTTYETSATDTTPIGTAVPMAPATQHRPGFQLNSHAVSFALGAGMALLIGYLVIQGLHAKRKD